MKEEQNKQLLAQQQQQEQKGKILITHLEEQLQLANRQKEQLQQQHQ